MKKLVKRVLVPEYLERHEVKASGNGAVVYVPKKYKGRDAWIIIEDVKG